MNRSIRVDFNAINIDANEREKKNASMNGMNACGINNYCTLSKPRNMKCGCECFFGNQCDFNKNEWNEA